MKSPFENDNRQKKANSQPIKASFCCFLCGEVASWSLLMIFFSTEERSYQIFQSKMKIFGVFGYAIQRICSSYTYLGDIHYSVGAAEPFLDWFAGSG